MTATNPAPLSPAALAGPALASPAGTPVMRLYIEHQAIAARMNDHATSSEECDRLYPLLIEVERRLAAEPAASMADLAAKVLVHTNLREEPNNCCEPALLAECEALVAGAFA